MNASVLSETTNGKWKSISVGDEKYSICAAKTSGGWKISLTNLVEIWIEELEREEILQKCEKLNPSLSIEDIDVHQIVGEIFEDIPKHVAKVSVEKIRLSSELEGGIFEFEINLIRGGARRLWEDVTMPLCLAAGELARRQTILMDLIKKKDAEISEYRLNDAQLTRKHLRTEPFHEDLFKKNVQTQNAESCRNVFQRIMELRGDVDVEKSPIKVEPAKTCSAEALDNRETLVKIEVEENSEGNNTDLIVNNEGAAKTDDELKTETVVHEPNELVPKTERNSPSKTGTGSNKGKITLIKRYTRSAPASQAKRTKKSINDFIK